MSDPENVFSGREMPEMIDHSFENDLQEELWEILEVYDSDPEKEDFVMDDDCVSFENDLDNMEEQALQITDVNIASVCKYKDKNVLRLTSEEVGVMKLFKDPTWQHCLIQNRLKMQQLRQLYTRLTAIRNVYRDNQRQESENLLQQSETQMVDLPKTPILKLGMPYFKDQQCYGAPPNVESLSKVQNKEVTFRKRQRWMDWHQIILRNSVEASYYKYCESQLEQQISDIECQLQKTDGDVSKEDLQSRLDTFQNQLKALHKEKPQKTPPYGLNVGIDWLSIANTQLRGLHTVHECKAMWNIYLHPHISKKHWTAEENAKIKELVIKYRYEDWDNLARELGTNRSGYLVYVHYNTKLCNKFRQDRFLPNEDELLLEIVESCRLGSFIPWVHVASYFKDRSKPQLYHRYKYYLSCKNIRKGVFTEAEDILLVHLIRRFGKDFTKASKYMPYRTSIQLRSRYTNYLTHLSSMNLGNFTCADDEKILEHVRVHGEKWSDLASELSRTRSHVRQRHKTLRKWLDKNPSMKVEDVPRRKQSYLLQCNTERQRRMEAILKELEGSREPADLSAVETLLKQQKKPSSPPARRDVRNKRVAITLGDYRLLDFVQGNSVSTTKIGSEDLPVDECAQCIYKLLELLGADVNKVVKDATVEGEDASLLTDHELEILKTLKGHLSDTAITSTSHSMLQHKPKMKSLVPPNCHTLLSLRTFLPKFELYKEIGDATVWKLEHNSLKLDEDSRAEVISERKLFATRFKAFFKWPCWMSMEFPESVVDSAEGVKGSDSVLATPKSGRPVKRRYPEVLQMLEAKKQKLKPGNTSEGTSDDTDDASNGNKVTQQQKKPNKSKHPVLTSYLFSPVILKQGPADKISKRKKVSKTSNLPELYDVDNQAQTSTSNFVQNKRNPKQRSIMKSPKQETKEKQIQAVKIQKQEKVTNTYDLPELCDDNQAQTSTNNYVPNKQNPRLKSRRKKAKR